MADLSNRVTVENGAIHLDTRFINSRRRISAARPEYNADAARENRLFYAIREMWANFRPDTRAALYPLALLPRFTAALSCDSITRRPRFL